MKAWFEGLAPRERLLVLAGSAALLLLLIYVLAWLPLRSAYHAMQEKVADQRETAVWMQESAQQLARLKGVRGPATQGLGGQSLLALADSSARADGLGDVLKRVEPDGSNSVKVWMDGASFDVLLRWLGNLNTRYGINIDTVTMESGANAAGRVNVRLTLQAPES
jgi:general secretion pathway protein M